MLYDVIRQLEVLEGTYLAKRSLIDFDECIRLLKNDSIRKVIYYLKQLEDTDWEHRLYSYETIITEANLTFLDLKKMISILEKREKSTLFSRIIKKFKFDWLPLRKGGIYNLKKQYPIK